MTSEDDQPDDEQPKDSDDESWSPLSLLRVLMTIVEKTDVEIAATVLVSGQWLSGMVISRSRYLEAVALEMQAATTTGEPAQGDAGDLLTGFANGLGRTRLENDSVPHSDREPGPELFLRTFAGQALGGDAIIAVRTDTVSAVCMGAPEPP